MLPALMVIIWCDTSYCSRACLSSIYSKEFSYFQQQKNMRNHSQLCKSTYVYPDFDSSYTLRSALPLLIGGLAKMKACVHFTWRSRLLMQWAFCAVKSNFSALRWYILEFLHQILYRFKQFWLLFTWNENKKLRNLDSLLVVENSFEGAP